MPVPKRRWRCSALALQHFNAHFFDTATCTDYPPGIRMPLIFPKPSPAMELHASDAWEGREI